MTTTPKTKKILVVSSDSHFMERFARLRSINGLAVEHARSGEESVVLVRVLLPELVLISNDIADMSPVHLAQRLRASVPSETVPIVVVGLDHTAIERSILSNESVSLVADKSPTEKQAELAGETATDEHRQRNGEANCSESQANLTCHDVRLDRNKHGVWVQDRAVRLTPTEFKLLWELASRPGYVLSRKELSQRCKRADRAIQTRTVDAHIKSIRRKLEGRAGLIETVHGVGYRFLDIDLALDN